MKLEIDWQKLGIIGMCVVVVIGWVTIFYVAAHFIIKFW